MYGQGEGGGGGILYILYGISLFRRIVIWIQQNAHILSSGHFQTSREVPMIVSIKLRPRGISKVDHLRKMSNFWKF